MSSNPSTEKPLTNKKKTQQQNALPKRKQKMVEQNSHILPNTQTVTLNNEDQYSILIEESYGIQARNLSDVLSYIAETISKDELKRLFFNLKQKQPITLPTLERKQKMFQLPTRRELLSKNPTAAIRQLLRQNEEDPYGNMNILGDSLLEYHLAEIPYEIIQNKPQEPLRRKKEILTSDQKMEIEQLRQRQFQEQEDLYDRMSLLGDSIREYDVTEVPDGSQNKFHKQHKKREVLTHEQKMEREQLRQLQLQEQEDLYDQMDLLGETLLKFSPLQPNTSSFQKSIEDAHAINSVPSETPQTSSGPRRPSKYLSPAQVAQLAKIRKKRYEQQEREYSQGELSGVSVPIVLKDKYSFRQPNARLQSPRELVFRKSILNMKNNKDSRPKALIIPVMNFPPRNWPTPIIPEVRLDLDKLRNEQRQYFLSMQQAQALEKPQYPNKNQDQDQNQGQNTQQGQNSKSTQNLEESPRQNRNKHTRNSIGSHDEENLFSKKDHHKTMKYLYLILFIQWLLITGIVSFFKYYEPSSLWLKSSGDWSWLYILCTLNLVIISFIIFPVTRNIYPINLIMLIIFILLVAFLFSFVEIYYPNDVVLLALGCICVICLVFALFFCQIRYNFTIYGGLCLCSIIILLNSMIFYLLIDDIVLQVVYAAIAVTLYSIYLVCNTRAIVKEKSKFHIETDSYFLGVIHLNLDFVFITVDKIQCF